MRELTRELTERPDAAARGIALAIIASVPFWAMALWMLF